MFSYGVTPHLEGDAATTEYETEGPGKFYVFVEAMPAVDGFECSAANMPDLGALDGLDIYVVDVNFSWTFVRTHEERIGPFFSRREWVYVGGAVPS